MNSWFLQTVNKVKNPQTNYKKQGVDPKYEDLTEKGNSRKDTNEIQEIIGTYF